MSIALDPTELQRFFHDQRGEMVSFLTRLIEAESPSMDANSQEPVFSLLSASFERMQYNVEHVHGIKSGGHLLARPTNYEKDTLGQIMIGHSDTVWPVGSIQNMPVSIDGNRLRGPGVYDMKAGLAQIVFSLKALADLNLKPALPPIVFVNSDEEIGSAESTPHIIELAKRAKRAFILEPSFGPTGKLKTARKGVGRFTITILGKSAHAGLEPEKGVSSILELSFLIQKLFSLNDPDQGITVNVGKIDGGTRANVIASMSKALVDVRVPTRDLARQVEAAIYDLKPTTPGVQLKIEGRIGRPPLEPTPRNQALWETARDLGHSLNLELEQAQAGGGSDGNTTSLYTATLDGLGAVGDGAHADHEFIYIDRWIERCVLLALLLHAPPPAIK